MKKQNNYSAKNCSQRLPKHFNHITGLKTEETPAFWKLCQMLDFPYLYVQVLPFRISSGNNHYPVFIVVNPSIHGCPTMLVKLAMEITAKETSLEQAVKKYMRDIPRFREYARRSFCPNCKFTNATDALAIRDERGGICSVDFVQFHFLPDGQK